MESSHRGLPGSIALHHKIQLVFSGLWTACCVPYWYQVKIVSIPVPTYEHILAPFGCLDLPTATPGQGDTFMQRDLLNAKKSPMRCVEWCGKTWDVADIGNFADTAWAFISATEALPQDVEQLLSDLQEEPAGWLSLITYYFKGYNLSVIALYLAFYARLRSAMVEHASWVSVMSNPLLSAGFELHGQQPSTVAACCLHLMHSVSGGMLNASMCSRLQACLASRGKALHTDTLKIHLSSVTSPAIHGASLSSAGLCDCGALCRMQHKHCRLYQAASVFHNVGPSMGKDPLRSQSECSSCHHTYHSCKELFHSLLFYHQLQPHQVCVDYHVATDTTAVLQVCEESC